MRFLNKRIYDFAVHHSKRSNYKDETKREKQVEKICAILKTLFLEKEMSVSSNSCMCSSYLINYYYEMFIIFESKRIHQKVRGIDKILS